MAIQGFLAMTGAELALCNRLPPKAGWMACHFSPSSPGLSNLPKALPEGSLLILNDRLPICGHDKARIAEELSRVIWDHGCCALLLDFQRPDIPEAKALTGVLTEALPCPVAVTPPYADGNTAAVFLPPLPCHLPLSQWIAPWQGRELWLELALDRETITLTDKGASIAPVDLEPETGFEEKNLHCHYSAAVEEDQAVFSLWRTRDDLAELLLEAETLGVTTAVGLYQELSPIPRSP